MIPSQKPYGYYQPQMHGPIAPNPVPVTQNPPQPEVYIELTKEQRPIIKNLVNAKEKIIYAGSIDKVNKYQTVQRRILVITDKTLYNIEPNDGLFSFSMCSNTGGYSIKRRIPIAKIFGATISVNQSSKDEQFIIHVSRDYDYRYNGKQKRERILKCLMNAHFLNTREPFLIYCREEASLANYHTTDDDLAVKKNRRPKEGKIYVTAEMIPNGLGWLIFNRKELAYKSSLLPNGPISNPVPPMPYNPNQYGGYGAPTNFPGPQGPFYGAPTNVPGPYNGPVPPGPNSNQGYGQGYGATYDYRPQQQPQQPENKPVYYVPQQPGPQSPMNQTNPQFQQNNTQNYGYGAQPQRPSTQPQQPQQPYGQYQPQSPINNQVVYPEFAPTAPNQNVQLNFDSPAPVKQNVGAAPTQNRGNVAPPQYPNPPQYPTFNNQGGYVPQYPTYGGQGNMRPNY